MSHHLHCSLSQLQQRNEPKSILCAPACLLFLQHSSHVYAQTGLFYSITSHSRNKPPFLTRLSLDCSIHWSFHHSKDLRHVQGKILNIFFKIGLRELKWDCFIFISAWIIWLKLIMAKTCWEKNNTFLHLKVVFTYKKLDQKILFLGGPLPIQYYIKRVSEEFSIVATLQGTLRRH